MPRARSSGPCAGSVTTGRSVLGAVTLSAAQLAAPVAAQTLISPDAFLDAVVGKTVTFHEIHSGIPVGTEQFLSRTLTAWRRTGEGCVYGQVTTLGGQICFLYDNDPDGPVCWWPFLHDGDLLVRLATLRDSEIQRISSITDDDLECPTVPTG